MTEYLQKIVVKLGYELVSTLTLELLKSIEQTGSLPRQEINQYLIDVLTTINDFLVCGEKRNV